MPKQPAFPGLRDAMKKKQTRRELFLLEMDAVVPWGCLLSLIEPSACKLRHAGGHALAAETIGQSSDGMGADCSSQGADRPKSVFENITGWARNPA